MERFTLVTEDSFVPSAGDAIMTDKGFMLVEYAGAMGVRFIRPTELHQDSISPEQATRGAELSAARAHVERAVRSFQLFDYLVSRPIRQCEFPLFDDIMTFLMCVINFNGPLRTSKSLSWYLFSLVLSLLRVL
jgi:hypothetical protein